MEVSGGGGGCGRNYSGTMLYRVCRVCFTCDEIRRQVASLGRVN